MATTNLRVGGGVGGQGVELGLEAVQDDGLRVPAHQHRIGWQVVLGEHLTGVA